METEINIRGSLFTPDENLHQKAAELLRLLESDSEGNRGLARISLGFQDLSNLAREKGCRRISCISNAFFGILTRMGKDHEDDLSLVMDTAFSFLASLERNRNEGAEKVCG